MLIPSDLTFQSITEAYAKILSDNPGKALTYTSFAAVLLRGGQLHLALMRDQAIHLGSASPLTEERWDPARNCWLDHASPEVSSATLNFPELFELSGRTVMSFNAGAVRFEFEGDSIQDPTISECGRFPTVPSYYGFTQLRGGAWELALQDGSSIYLKDQVLCLMNITGDIIGRVLLSEIVFDYDVEFKKAEASWLPEALANAAKTSSGMIEFAVPSRTAEAVAEGFKLGLFEIIGNGIAQITDAGKTQVARNLAAAAAV